jgi:squalene cyclase
MWKCFLEATASKCTQTVLVNEKYLNKNHVKTTIQGLKMKVVTNPMVTAVYTGLIFNTIMLE